MTTRMTGTPFTTQRRPSGDDRIDRLAGDVRLAIGSRIEAMRAQHLALAEQDAGLWEEPDRTRERRARPFVPNRLTDGLRRNLP